MFTCTQCHSHFLTPLTLYFLALFVFVYNVHNIRVCLGKVRYTHRESHPVPEYRSVRVYSNVIRITRKRGTYLSQYTVVYCATENHKQQPAILSTQINFYVGMDPLGVTLRVTRDKKYPRFNLVLALRITTIC